MAKAVVDPVGLHARETLAAMPRAASTVSATSGMTSTAISLDRICMFRIMC